MYQRSWETRTKLTGIGSDCIVKNGSVGGNVNDFR